MGENAVHQNRTQKRFLPYTILTWERDCQQGIKEQPCWVLSLGTVCTKKEKQQKWEGKKKNKPRSEAGNARAHAAPFWADVELQEQRAQS